MAVAQRFIFEWPNGVKPVQLFEWVEMLSREDQQLWKEARQRQENIRQEAIDANRMHLGKKEYIWKDDREAIVGKLNDPLWEQMWNRYLQETQTQFKVVYEEVVETVGQGPGG